MEKERSNERVKIFLANGYKYEGVILDDNDGFILLKDMFDKQIRISKAQITVIEPLGVQQQ